MASYVARRLLQLIPITLALATLIFVLIHLIPGDPAQVILGAHATPSAIARLHKAWHLTDPLPVQYFFFLVRLVQLNLGTSIYYQIPVRDLLASRLPETLLLAFLSMLLSVVIAFPLAVVAAVSRDSWLDRTIRVLTTLGFAMPSFWIALLLML
ncbi:MAG: ABC transporter permease, partial [Chloroflexota bacterium]|nr:ABC transporter permease [Chloroflexota bacterium]MDQ2741528.1 ABC transporter permease [Chloroflexota bacterium]